MSDPRSEHAPLTSEQVQRLHAEHFRKSDTCARACCIVCAFLIANRDAAHIGRSDGSDG